MLCLLEEHITGENHEELLAGVSGKSVRLAEEWLAARFPRPDAPTVIRKLPDARGPAGRSSTARGQTSERPASIPASAVPSLAEDRVTHSPSAAESVTAVPPPAATAAPATAPPGAAVVIAAAAAPTADRAAAAPTADRGAWRGRIDPLSEARYRVQLTASRELKEKLELARDLTSHAAPGADLSVIIERAVDLLIADLGKKRFGETSRPQRARGAREARDGGVASATKRAVLERDGMACAYVDAEGRRCGERAFLQRDHVDPRGRGGGSDAENLRHLCAGHNRLMAEVQYGRGHVERAMAARRERERPRAGPPG